MIKFRVSMPLTKSLYLAAMKKLLRSALLSAVLSFSCFSASAQFQSFFGQEDTHWKLFGTFTSPETSSVDSLAFEGDTVIDGHAYARYDLYMYTVDAMFDPESVWNAFEYTFTERTLYLRESPGADTLFLGEFEFSDDEFLVKPICVMNIDQGDTFLGNPVISSFIDSEGRKVVLADMGFYTLRMTEGVGPDRFFQNNDLSQIICQFKDGMINYLTSDAEKAQFCADNPLSAADGTSAAHDVKLFPNPARSFLRFDSSVFRPISFAVFDLSGKQVMGGGQGNAFTEIYIGDLPEGMYLLRLDDGTQAVNLKWVKQ